MLIKEKEFNFIYKITNTINKNYYVGMHSTNDMNDGYMGSGKRIITSISEYGVENFIREILEYLPNRELLIKREMDIVNGEMLKDIMCLNIKKGGDGGFVSEEAQTKRSIAANKALNKKLKNDNLFLLKFKNSVSEGLKKAYINGWIPPATGNKYRLGLITSESTKTKIGNANKISQKGERNSSFGTIWITDGMENKKINSDCEIPHGWRSGRYHKKEENKTSIYLGVRFNKSSNRWYVSIRYEKKSKFCGSYISEYDAAIGYDITMLKTYGNLVSLNFEENREKYLNNEIFVFTSTNKKLCFKN